MRILFGVILFLAVIVAPLPMTLILMTFGFLYFPRYFEAVAAAFVIEVLYRGGGSDIIGSHLPLAVLALIALCVVEVLRTFIREQRA